MRTMSEVKPGTFLRGKYTGNLYLVTGHTYGQTGEWESGRILCFKSGILCCEKCNTSLLSPDSAYKVVYEI